jgi:hypothetical protein
MPITANKRKASSMNFSSDHQTVISEISDLLKNGNIHNCKEFFSFDQL